MPHNRIPVTLVSAPRFLAALDPETALLRLPANTGHGHADGEQCPACAAQLDIRAQLFNLLEEARQGLRPPFSKVVVDASAVQDQARLVAALQGKLPAQALRDHAVARAFYLASEA
ncbi:MULTISPECIES: hypothetical protein [unclassified Devosia]|uniref:hypothetical protein n=1 Tax=unclassified Devosia TaxID=196773 RepID=UPI001554BB9B|nr:MULTISPECIES: hypothetical protein [unclassified Devosia]